MLSLVRLFETLWTVICQALLSMGFPRQKYWSGLPFPPPGDISDPGIVPASSTIVVQYLYFKLRMFGSKCKSSGM